MSAATGGKVGFIQRLLHGAGSGKRPQTTFGARVLVIDDSATVCAAVSRMLVSEDYRVLTAADGQAGIALAISEQPALLFLDVVMPELDGGEVFTQFRTDPVLKHTPIIFLTSIVRQKEVDEHKGMIGGSFFLAKPVNADGLIGAIEEHLHS